MLAFTRTGEILRSALSLNPPLALNYPPPLTLKSTDAFGAETSTLTGFTSTLAVGAFTEIPALKSDDSLKPTEPPKPPLV
jgi:hypothetical protein